MVFARKNDHQQLVALILQQYGSLYRLRLWKNNTGFVKTEDRGVRFGLIGSADILGILGDSGRFVAIEVKAGKDKQKTQQVAFQQMVERYGGLFVLARSIADVENALRPHLILASLPPSQ